MATPCHDHDRRKRPPRRLPAPQGALETVGPLLSRAGLGHRARGLQRGRRRLGLPPARPRPIARLPLERGRHRRHLRPPPAPLLRAGALERARSDPQGAAVRPHRRRRQPRRGREGVLLLSRQHADALVHESISTSTRSRSIPYARLVEENRRRGREAPEFELLDTGDLRRATATSTCSSSTPRPIAEDHPDADHGAQPRAGGGAAPRPADALVPQHLVVDRRNGSSIARGHGRCARRAARSCR